MSRWNLKGADVGNLCAPDKKRDSVDELSFFRRLLIQLYKEGEHKHRVTNRILLEPLDYGKDLPTEKQLTDLSTSPWVSVINTAVLSMSRIRNEKVYDKAKYSELSHPIQAGDNWMLILCLPGH